MREKLILEKDLGITDDLLPILKVSIDLEVLQDRVKLKGQEKALEDLGKELFVEGRKK